MTKLKEFKRIAVQLKLAPNEYRSIRISAAQRDLSVSDFLTDLVRDAIRMVTASRQDAKRVTGQNVAEFIRKHKV